MLDVDDWRCGMPVTGRRGWRNLLVAVHRAIDGLVPPARSLTGDVLIQSIATVVVSVPEAAVVPVRPEAVGIPVPITPPGVVAWHHDDLLRRVRVGKHG